MTIALRFLKDRRKSTLWWIFGIVVFLVLQIAFYPSFKNPEIADTIENAMRDLPDGIAAQIGLQGGHSITSPAGFLNGQVFALILPLGLLIYGIALGARALAGSEDDGTLELILANPVSRTRAAVERYGAMVAGIVIVGMFSTLVIAVLCLPLELIADGVTLDRVAAAGLACTCLVLFFASLAFLVGCTLGGRGTAIAIPSAIAVAGFIHLGLVNANIILFTRFVNPWWWYGSRNITIDGLPPESILLPVALSALCLVAGVWRFRLRDLH